MFAGAVNQKLVNIQDRLKYTSEKDFKGFLENNFISLFPNEDDIFYTFPMLFLWLDTFEQSITNASTTQEDIKLVKSEIYRIPKVEYKYDKENTYELYCIADFSFNPNLSTKNEFDNYIKKLEGIKIKAETFFKL